MPLDAFTNRLGIEQGRLVSEVGTVTFVLGSLTPGREHDLAPGDYVELVQRADLTHVDVVRVHASLRVPEVPAGLAWELAIAIDGIRAASVRGWPGSTREVSDLGAPTSHLFGEHEVALRLALIEA
jgi:hypothetical protein